MIRSTRYDILPNVRMPSRRRSWPSPLAELHGDLFSRHAGPFEVYVFVAFDERGEHAVSNEICRRCSGKQQGRRRGGRSVQLPDSFMI